MFTSRLPLTTDQWGRLPVQWLRAAFGTSLDHHPSVTVMLASGEPYVRCIRVDVETVKDQAPIIPARALSRSRLAGQPETPGKAERFDRIPLEEWAYVLPY